MTLYKYLDPERIDVLENKRLRFSQINALNDPFEGKPFYEQLAPRDVLKKSFGDGSSEGAKVGAELGFDFIGEILQNLKSSLPDEHKHLMTEIVDLIPPKDEFVRKLLQEYPEHVEKTLLPLCDEMMPEIRQKIIQTFNSEWGIFCLAEDFGSNLMWAHYAGNSRGFVLGFDDSHGYFDKYGGNQTKIDALWPVDYSKRRPQAQNILNLTIEDVVFTKPIEWSYESEWRILKKLSFETLLVDSLGNAILDELNEPIHLVPFPADALESIFIGSRANASLQVHLLGLIANEEYQHVTVYQAKESERYYQLDFEPIEDLKIVL